jgi:hypothetical protein
MEDGKCNVQNAKCKVQNEKCKMQNGAIIKNGRWLLSLFLKSLTQIMNKEIYLVRGTGAESYRQFTARIMQLSHSVTEAVNPEQIKVVFTSEPPPAVSIIPFKKKMVATISIFKKDPLPVALLVNSEGFAGGYRVTGALPVAYEKTWPDGELTPGICLLTLFNRKKGLDYDTFIHRWHNSHTPLSLKIHPLWNYSRNVVNEFLVENSEKFEGIVEEQMRTDADLLNPFRFFGNPMVIVPRMIEVYRDTKSFLDYSGIETYLAREVVVRS